MNEWGFVWDSVLLSLHHESNRSEPGVHVSSIWGGLSVELSPLPRRDSHDGSLRPRTRPVRPNFNRC